MKKKFGIAIVGIIIIALIAIYVAEYTFLEPILFGHYETYLKTTILYSKVPEEQWIWMYSNHTGVKDFVEKFENHTIHQELVYGQKKIIYEHMDHGITTQIIVYVGVHFSEFIIFHCADENFGWSIPMFQAIFIEDMDCQKILPKAKKFRELQEPVNKHLQMIADNPKAQP
ncbi:MAG: hypothetical protein OXC46_02690 [Thaumarchaeota archaeon]|nr:hypothetical protein [Nitrososphaerota archaeon]